MTQNSSCTGKNTDEAVQELGRIRSKSRRAGGGERAQLTLEKAYCGRIELISVKEKAVIQLNIVMSG